MQGQMQAIKATTAAIKAYTQGDLAWSTLHDLNDLVRKLTTHSPAMFQSAARALGPGQSQISTDIAARCLRSLIDCLTQVFSHKATACKVCSPPSTDLRTCVQPSAMWQTPRRVVLHCPTARIHSAPPKH